MLFSLKRSSRPDASEEDSQGFTGDLDDLEVEGGDDEKYVF